MARRTRAQMEGDKSFAYAKQHRTYADQQEQFDMAACSPSCIAILKQLLKKLNGHARARALDVGAGDGRLTRFLLTGEYTTVDMLEPCPKGI